MFVMADLMLFPQPQLIEQKARPSRIFTGDDIRILQNLHSTVGNIGQVANRSGHQVHGPFANGGLGDFKSDLMIIGAVEIIRGSVADKARAMRRRRRRQGGQANNRRRQAKAQQRCRTQHPKRRLLAS